MADTTDLNQPQFFLDDTWIADSIRLQRVWHRAQKRSEPVLRGTEPWEGDLVVGYGSVLFHEGKFKMWYMVWPRLEATCRCVAYAQSDDGINWHKPSLGVVALDGDTNNNIVLKPDVGYVDCVGVIDDPDDAEWPLKMLYWHGIFREPDQTGICAARSKDGIHWDMQPGLVLPRHWGDRTTFMPHRDNGKFVVFGRHRPLKNYYDCRVVSRTESEDLVHWSEPELILKPDLSDDAALEIYSASGFRWKSLYLGCIERMHMVPDVLDSEIWFSHDGRQWQRSQYRPAFIERSPEPAFDSGWVSTTCNAPIPSGEELLIHFSGRTHGHAAHRGVALRIGAIGLATLRLDGFCSLQATEREGWLVTEPMRWCESELRLNADPRRDIRTHPKRTTGEVLVEVRTDEGTPIEGFTFDDCIPLRDNTACAKSADATSPVMWRNEKRMADLAGHTVRLAFRLRDAHLYTFRAGND